MLGALFVCACGDRSTDDVVQSLQAVIDGEASDSDQDGVVFIAVSDGAESWAHCTATLISPRVLVTAKHCVTGIQSGEFYCSGGGELLAESTGGGTFAALPPPESVQVYIGAMPVWEQPVARGGAIHAMPSDHVCRDDVAVVVIDRPIDWVSVVPIRRDAQVRVGEMVTLVGYGENETSNEAVRRVRHDVRVLDVGAMTEAEEHPNPTTPPRTFTVGGNTVCYGDSGGPALSEDGELVGILSRLSGDCYSQDNRNTYMAAAGYLDLIDQALAETKEPSSVAMDVAPQGNAGAPSESVSTAGAPSDDPEEAGAAPDIGRRPGSSDVFRCQFSGGPFSIRAPTSWLAWVGAVLVALWRRSFAGAASPGGRGG